MSLTVHQMTVPLFLQMLNALLGWLDKAEALAKAKKFDPNNFVGMRLAPDMLPFARQVQIATDHVKGGLARLAGQEPPKWADEEKTLDELRARVRKAIDYANAVTPAQLEGGERRAIKLPIPGGALEMSGEAFLRGFSIPNFFFHVTMAYALLRQGGVDVGKMDYLGGVPR